MKRLLAFVLVLVALLSLAACGKEDKNETGASSDDVEVRVAALGGSTGVGMAKLMDDGNYDVEIIAEPNEMVAGVKAGTYDIAALPVNVAAKLYKMTDGGVQVVALNTLGVLHVLENGEQTTLVDSAETTVAITTEKADDAVNVQFQGWEQFGKSFEYMGVGMLGVFIIVSVIIGATYAVNYFCNKFSK